MSASEKKSQGSAESTTIDIESINLNYKQFPKSQKNL